MPHGGAHRLDGDWLAVTAGGVIVKAVNVTDGGHGWLVDSVEKCG